MAKQNCMNCKNRTGKNQCLIKIDLSNNFAIRGGRSKKSAEIVFSDENDCLYTREELMSKLLMKKVVTR